MKKLFMTLAFWCVACFSPASFAQWSCVDSKGDSYKALQRIWADTCTNDSTGEVRLPNQLPPPVAQKKSNPAAAKKALELSKSALLSELKDPKSAQFRGLFVYNDVFLCGEVNSKNSFGGYVGFQRFVSLGEARLVELDDQSQKFEDWWLMSCKGMSKSLIQEYRFGR